MAHDDTGIEVVATSDTMAPATTAHLLHYDSTYGRWRRTIASGEDTLRGARKGILRYGDEPIVSRDSIGDPSSCVFDAGPTRVSDG